tara:strand:+ start:338 stop:628 length:291 start_codon:yes stop_codon:yes gene_type:complete
MKIYICDTPISATVHSTKAKAVAALREFNKSPLVVTESHQRKYGGGSFIKKTIKDSITLITLNEGDEVYFEKRRNSVGDQRSEMKVIDFSFVTPRT